MKLVTCFDAGERRLGVPSGSDIVDLLAGVPTTGQPGDIVECEVEKIGVLRKRVVAG